MIRQRIPESGVTTFHDHVYGSISWRNDLLDDQVLLKSDGYPTYNFANVVDDHLMRITHVMRGVEYLSSTPKYNLLYDSFGWPVPEYIHMPHIVKEDGKKLSKRSGDASFQDLVARATCRRPSSTASRCWAGIRPTTVSSLPYRAWSRRSTSTGSTSQAQASPSPSLTG